MRREEIGRAIDTNTLAKDETIIKNKAYFNEQKRILAKDLKYKADFIVFKNDGSFEIIDVKGFKTEQYKIKKKVFEDKYNFTIDKIMKIESEEEHP